MELPLSLIDAFIAEDIEVQGTDLILGQFSRAEEATIAHILHRGMGKNSVRLDLGCVKAWSWDATGAAL